MKPPHQPSQQRLRRFQRALVEDAPAFRLTERDTQILQTVADYRVLSAAQIRRLFFGFTNKSSQCDHRLKGLYHHKFLERRPQPAFNVGDNKPILYSIAKLGVQRLSEQSRSPVVAFRWPGIQGTVPHLYLDHLLHMNDVRIALTQGCRLLEFSLNQWITEQAIRRAAFVSRKNAQVSSLALDRQVIPDGICIFSSGDASHTLFIELDRGTETLEKLYKKFQNYLVDYKSGLLTKEYQVKDLRVLVVTTTLRRLMHMVDKMKSLEASHHFAFTYQPLVTPENVFTSPIWYQAEAAKPISLFGNRTIVDSEIQSTQALPVERVTEVFADWWKVHNLQSIATDCVITPLPTLEQSLDSPSYSALGKWSIDQWLLLSYQLPHANQAIITSARLLSQVETEIIRTRLYG